MDERRQRMLAANEAMFRSLNEMVDDASPVGAHANATFLCECGNDLCAEEIELTEDEYEHVRADARRFVVAPGHVAPEIESIVEKEPRHWIVEKRGEAAAVALATDPRSAD